MKRWFVVFDDDISFTADAPTEEDAYWQAAQLWFWDQWGSTDELSRYELSERGFAAACNHDMICPLNSIREIKL